jgi:hypothetical protein
MAEEPSLIVRFMTLILGATSVFVTLVLLFVGYEVAIMIMAAGYTQGHMSKVVLAAGPSVFALLSLPFWLTLRRLTRTGPVEEPKY